MNILRRSTRISSFVFPNQFHTRGVFTFPYSSVSSSFSTQVPLEGNTPASIHAKVGRNLHMLPQHPLHHIKVKIQSHFNKKFTSQNGEAVFKFFDEFTPIVSVKHNFDDLLFPEDHPARAPTDTYYVDPVRVLRTHTSAHQSTLFRNRETAFLVTGDVYRRDEIDMSHYPVFHQMEGARLFSATPPMAGQSTQFYYDDGAYKSHFQIQKVEADLKQTLEGMVSTLFGNVEKRWIDAFFPFTTPSYELEIFFKGAWLEVLGCGVVHPEVLTKCGINNQTGWAFGLGLERLAMVLFDIPDIRLFWSTDPRFRSQFKLSAAGDIDFRTFKFKSFSKYPECFKDITFWLPAAGYHENHFYETVREIAGDLCESAKLVDKFTHPTTGKNSHCYRINFRSMERSLTNKEVNEMMEKIIAKVTSMGAIIR